MVFHNTVRVGWNSLDHHDQLCVKKVAVRKQNSPSHPSIDKQRKDATGDGDNAEIQIVTETYNAKNDTHEQKTIERNGTKNGNSAKKPHDQKHHMTKPFHL